MFLANWDNTGVTVELGDLVASGVNIWDFDYPVPAKEVTYNGKTAKVPFDKKAFEQKILDHYRFRQIGQETPGRFKHYFKTRIREIMPYYVQLYEFEAKWFNIEDPLESYNLLETFKQDTTGKGKVTGKADSHGTSDTSGGSEVTQNKENRFSDTPQGSIDNLDNYMTTASRDTIKDTGTQNSKVTSADHGTSEQASEDSGTVSHTLTRRGNIGVQPLGTEVKNIRDAFINIDLMVINDLNDLFLQVY